MHIGHESPIEIHLLHVFSSLFSIVFHTGHGDVTDITPSSSDESQCSGIVLPVDEAVELDEAGGRHGQRGFRERTR